MGQGGRRAGSGRKPTPLALVKLRNNPGKRPVPAESIKPAAYEGGCPAKLTNPDAIQFWNDHAPVHCRLGLLTEISLPDFMLLCQAWGEFWQEDTTAYRRDAAFARWRFLSAGFGIDPASLMRLHVSAAERQQDPVDAYRAKRRSA